MPFPLITNMPRIVWVLQPQHADWSQWVTAVVSAGVGALFAIVVNLVLEFIRPTIQERQAVTKARKRIFPEATNVAIRIKLCYDLLKQYDEALTYRKEQILWMVGNFLSRISYKDQFEEYSKNKGSTLLLLDKTGEICTLFKLSQEYVAAFNRDNPTEVRNMRALVLVVGMAGQYMGKLLGRKAIVDAHRWGQYILASSQELANSLFKPAAEAVASDHTDARGQTSTIATDTTAGKSSPGFD